MSILRRAVERHPEQRSIESYRDSFLTFKGVFGVNPPATANGIYVTKDAALNLSAVWACVNLIANVVAGLPWDSFIKQGQQRIPQPDPTWMMRPNPEITDFEMRHEMTSDLLLGGNTFALKVHDRQNELRELWPLANARVRPFRDSAKDANGNTASILRYSIDGREEYGQNDILHIKAFALPGMLRGYDPITYMSGSVGNALAANEFSNAFFGNAATPSGVLEMPEGTNETQAKATWDVFRDTNGGIKNAGNPAVLTGAKWVPISVNPEQAQLIATQMHGINEICRWFGVPPHMVEDMSSKASNWGTGLEQQMMGFLTFTIMPWLVRWEKALNPLLPQQGAYIKWNLDGLLRADLKTRYESYLIGREGRWLCADDVLAMEDRSPLPNGQGQIYANPLIASTPTGGGTP
jgi:HK97 family phage portal protein